MTCVTAPGAHRIPDVLCNREIKFGIWLSTTRARLGARSDSRPDTTRGSIALDGGPALRKARDAEAGSILLSARGRSRALRQRALFPHRVSSRPRSVRAEPARPDCRRTTSPTAPASVSSANVRSANSLCALHPDLAGRLIVTEAGDVVGRHRGLAFYTLGSARRPSDRRSGRRPRKKPGMSRRSDLPAQ